MEPKQFNVPMPLFAHQEFADLQRELRKIGSKPARGDLVAALIHWALEDPEAAKQVVEAYVRHELAQEEEAAEAEES
jgi:hypothetical protein